MTYQVQRNNPRMNCGFGSESEFIAKRVQFTRLGVMLLRTHPADVPEGYFAAVNTTWQYLPSMKAVQELLEALKITEKSLLRKLPNSHLKQPIGTSHQPQSHVLKLGVLNHG